MQKAIKEYFNYLQKYPNKEEIQYRTSFEIFFKDFTNELNIQNIVIIQEDRDSSIETDGTPDFFVYREHDKQQPKFFVGFIECKKPTIDLDKIKESEQIKKYEKTTDNIILTNYHRFILLRKGKAEHDVTLSEDTNVIQRFENLLKDFYSYTYPHIKTKKTLVAELAKQSFYYAVELREFIENKQNENENFYTKFNGLFTEYQTSISYHYELTDFCDIYSQSLVYGLMLARIDTNKDLDEEGLNYLEDISKEYKLLYEFLSQAYVSNDLPTSLKRALISIGKNINMIDTEAIQNEFNKTGEGKQHIAVFLYEDFLQAYDNLKKTEKRKESGVYYTPAEATNFITRSVNEIIKTCFNLQDGYLADRIKILDFACGTGTFLHSVFEEMISGNKDDLSKEIIRNKIETDIYGFELLFVPYIISHTILTRFLKENGINIEKRLGIFLTNTLDISQHSISSLLPNLKREYEKAMDVKSNEHILAIIGNPPYFVGKSQSINEVIDGELKEYKKDLNEKNIRHLEDIYLKFIRFAEWKIEKQKQGIIGIITNNSYLDGVTHRQIRKHLLETFDEIYILNLHGNARKKETDKNIFDIMVGVAIVLFVKLPKKTTKKTVKYFSTMDNKLITRSEKLDFLENTKFKKVKWVTLEPSEPYYWFIDKDFSLKDEYNKFWKVTNIFEYYNMGVTTGNDNLAIQYTKKQFENMMNDFKDMSIEQMKAKYNIVETNYWTVQGAKESLETGNFDKKFIKSITYRPFDYRYTFLHDKAGFLQRVRYNTTKHFENENIGLCFSRNNDNFVDVFITNKQIDLHVISGQNYITPLYTYPDTNVFENAHKTPNFTAKFIMFLKTLDFKPNVDLIANPLNCVGTSPTHLNKRSGKASTKPEKILAYIYAILHSPIYRKKYIEFLKTDFPAMPFTKDKNIFEKYAKLGQRLIDLHLLREIPKDDTITVSNIPQSDFVIDKITYIDSKLLLQTTENKIITIEGITKEIYDFEIGSYKPIDKWLKYRKKDSVPLNSKDLKHIKDMAVTIKETISVMSEIGSLGEEYLK